MDSKRFFFSGLIVTGVVVSGIASADPSEQMEGTERGSPEPIREEVADPDPDRGDVQPMHERAIGHEEMQGQSDDRAPGDDPRDTDRTRELPPVGAKMGASTSYIVAHGDTLGSISERFLGDGKRWKEIAEANDIEDPKKLAVGMRLTLPNPGHIERRSDDDRMDDDRMNQNPQSPDRRDPMVPRGEETEVPPSRIRGVPPI